MQDRILPQGRKSGKSKRKRRSKSTNRHKGRSKRTQKDVFGSPRNITPVETHGSSSTLFGPQTTHLSKEEAGILDLLEYLARIGLVHENWIQKLAETSDLGVMLNIAKFARKSLELPGFAPGAGFGTKFEIKLANLQKLLDKQSEFQESTLKELILSSQSENQSVDQKLTEDAMSILNEIPESDLDLSGIVSDSFGNLVDL